MHVLRNVEDLEKLESTIKSMQDIADSYNREIEADRVSLKAKEHAFQHVAKALNQMKEDAEHLKQTLESKTGAWYHERRRVVRD
jgi:chromosome segregation ATPase